MLKSDHNHNAKKKMITIFIRQRLKNDTFVSFCQPGRYVYRDVLCRYIYSAAYMEEI